MNLLLLKLAAAPLLILAASLAGRRWGESVSGWVVGLPLTSGPVCFFLAVEQGPDFAAATAAGCLAGAAAEACFCVAYRWAAGWAGWPFALAAGSLAFVAGAALLMAAAPSLMPLAAIALAALAVALALPKPPRWDIPLRMAIATMLVFGLTELAPLFGATASGLVATYPVFAAVLAAFAHYARGVDAAVQVLRGLSVGLFGFIGFFAALAPALTRLAIAPAFAIATLVALSIQGVSFGRLRG